MKDWKHYLILFFILTAGFLLFRIFNFNRQVQIWLTFAIAFIYLCWGIVYHWIKKELHLRIILEYLMVAALAGLVVIFLLLRT